MPEKEERYDLAIIGGGPGGYTAAIRASQLGMKVALIEKDRLGGVCLNRGCIPAKALLRNAQVWSFFKRGREFGISCDNLSFDYGAGVKRAFKIVNKLARGIELLLRKNKVKLLSGRASFSTPRQLEISNGEGKWIGSIRADRIIIATGSRPKPWPGLEEGDKRIIHSDEALFSSELPSSMIIIGGGAVGIEFAYLYSTFGVKVKLIEASRHILSNQDREMAEMLQRMLDRQGIEILLNTRVKGIYPDSAGVRVETDAAIQGRQILSAEKVLVAIGRMSNLDGLGLENAGLAESKGLILVDDRMGTMQEGIYAIGDVVGEPMLAHAASAEGIIAVENMAGLDRPPLDYDNIPFCLYCQPELARIGLTEEEARQRGYQIKVSKSYLRANGRAQTLGEDEGLVKIIAEAKEGRILGIHVLGSGASEIIGEIALAKTLGATCRDLARTVHPHPTLTEALMETALKFEETPVHF